jgi:hypothetical protein
LLRRVNATGGFFDSFFAAIEADPQAMQRFEAGLKEVDAMLWPVVSWRLH